MTDGSRADSLRRYASRQLDNMFPLPEGATDLDASAVGEAMAQTDHCVSKIRAFSGSHFDPQNSGHYATFLYFVAWQLGRGLGNGRDATRVFLLNKALNGIDLFHEVEMPPVFLIGHTVGMVFAKANYSSGCIFHQGCTVGRNQDSRPTLEPGVILYPNSSIIGACIVRENTVLTPGVQLVNTDTPGNCLVFPDGPGRVVFRPIETYMADRYLVRSLGSTDL